MPNDTIREDILDKSRVPDWILGPSKEGEFPAMPLGQIHVVAGSSGAGKTTLLFQMVHAIERGESFFGFPTAKHPMLYVTYDRSQSETDDTMARAGISRETLSTKALKLYKPKMTEPDRRFETDMQTLRNEFPEARVFIIDGFYSLVPYGMINDYLTVAEFLQRVRCYCEDYNLTIIGVAHSPKQREGNRVIDPRQMIQGSVAGAGYTSCGIVVLREKPEGGNQNRIIYFLPRNAAERKLEVGMTDNGLLDQRAWVASSDTSALHVKSAQHEAFDEMVLSQWAPGESFTTAEVVDMAYAKGISRNSVNAWVGELLGLGAIVRSSRGVYVVPGGASHA